ncbi:MAG: glycerate kinase [Clostridiales bacterium]|jgi:hydroxypyruvate reductase|nr:glycerate kinase [Clostridiales bacterium]
MSELQPSLYDDAIGIIQSALRAAQPDEAVKKALKRFHVPEDGRVIVIAVGKAAWQMAETAVKELGGAVSGGIVITKYGHCNGAIPKLRIYEAGHPVPDANSFAAADAAVEAVKGLNSSDRVLFLVSGGGSALFERPLIPASELEDLTNQLLACGADIVEINTLRKRLSAVKGGKFALLCAPARVFSIILSDIIGDPLDMIASGPAYPDKSTCDQAFAVIRKYGLRVTERQKALFAQETPKHLDNIDTEIAGGVSQLCAAAAEKCKELGYEPRILTASLRCTARDAGSFLASIAQYHSDTERPLAFIAGGETVVELKGRGLGGRNQEIALAAAAGIEGLENTAVFSIGSDGTDGPTDAAGGFADSGTAGRLRERDMDLYAYLNDNDAYHALDAVGGLIKTGPTGTNVNDLSVVLIKPLAQS